MGKTTLLQALGNPPESLTNAFVRGARRSGSLEALMTLLCAQTLVVRILVHCIGGALEPCFKGMGWPQL